MLTFIVWPITSGWCNLRLYRFWYIFFMLSYLKQVHGARCKGAANTLNALMSANLKRKLWRIKGTLSLICTHWPGSPQISFSSPISFITVNTATCPRHLATDSWASKLSTSFPGSFISPPQRGAFGVGRWKALETRLENLRLNIHPRGSVCSRNGSRKILSCKKIPILTFSTLNKHYISGVPFHLHSQEEGVGTRNSLDDFVKK